MSEKTSLGETLVSVWRQALTDGAKQVEVEGQTYRVTFTRASKLRVVRFKWQSHDLDGIEQNPHKTSRWAQLASQGKRVMQFSYHHRYVANVCEGKLLRYPAWRSLELPE